MYRARGATRRGQDSSNPLVSHLAHATKVLQLGKAFLNALFATKALMGPGQIRHVNLGLAYRQLDRYIRAPVPAVTAAQPPHVH